MPIERATVPVPVVDTARLRLRAFVQEDLDAYAAMCADAEVMRYIGTGQVVGREVAWRHMALFLGSWGLLGYGMWALEQRSSGRLVGRVGTSTHPSGHRANWAGCWRATPGAAATRSKPRAPRATTGGGTSG